MPTQARETAQVPAVAERPAAQGGRGARDTEAIALQRQIGNRSTIRVLQRKLGGKKDAGQLIKGSGAQIYEILESTADPKAKGAWNYRVRDTKTGKESSISEGSTKHDFTSATQVVEDAIDKKRSMKDVVSSLPEKQVNELAGFKAWIDKVEPKMKAPAFAELAAGIMVVSRHAPKTRPEALRQISAMLADKTVAKTMIKTPVQAVVIPRDKQMTELDEFKSLLTSDSGKGPGKTFDGREWAHVRGVGNVKAGGKTYAAITEENILGGEPDPKVFAEKKAKDGTVVTPAGDVAGGYTVGYSTTTHEFAHVLHLNGLDDKDKKVIAKAFADRRTASSGSADKLVKVWVDGPRVSPTAPKSWKDVGWTDETWMAHIAGLGDDARRPYECYSSQNDMEYFAQLSNAYLGTNLGVDPTTGKPRRNGRQWIKANESAEMLKLLDRLYAKKTVNDIKADGRLVKGGKCANPPKPPPKPKGPPPKKT